MIAGSLDLSYSYYRVNSSKNILSEMKYHILPQNSQTVQSTSELLSIKRRRMFAILWRQRGNIHNSSNRVVLLLRYVGENCETILRKPKASAGELTQIHTSYVNQESGVGLPADKNNDILIEKVQKLACTVYNLNNFILIIVQLVRTLSTYFSLQNNFRFTKLEKFKAWQIIIFLKEVMK